MFDFFYLEMSVEAVLTRRTDRRNAISIYISVANYFTAESALFVQNYSSAIPNSFPIATALFWNVAQLNPGLSPPKS